MFRILMKELDKFMKHSNAFQKLEMLETLTERLYDNCTSDIQKAELISIFTDAMEEQYERKTTNEEYEKATM